MSIEVCLFNPDDLGGTWGRLDGLEKTGQCVHVTKCNASRSAVKFLIAVDARCIGGPTVDFACLKQSDAWKVRVIGRAKRVNRPIEVRMSLESDASDLEFRVPRNAGTAAKVAVRFPIHQRYKALSKQYAMGFTGVQMIVKHDWDVAQLSLQAEFEVEEKGPRQAKALEKVNSQVLVRVPQLSISAASGSCGANCENPSVSSVVDLPKIISFESHQFRVALTFPGEHRDYVSEVAANLVTSLGANSVFYDQYYSAELAKPDMDLALQKIYHERADLVVVFLSEHYEKKEWCGLEWRAIRDLIKKHSKKVMLLRFDEADISGLFSVDGYISLRTLSAKDTADRIAERCKTNTLG